MMTHVSKQTWSPTGVDELEPGALLAVKSEANSIVLAGPGAGKTELLAQRAVYLLQTGLCRPPRRILAISFKKDSAANLKRRVESRCGSTLSRRFDSSTIDAFAKGLVDRFREALPDAWRPTADYQIDFDLDPNKRAWSNFLDSVPALAQYSRQMSEVRPTAFYWQSFVGHPLPLPPPTNAEHFELWAAAAAWKYLLHGMSRSRLNFDMIRRLAQLIFTSDQRILRALRSSYSHVFLDEFQDTTKVQYDLIRTCFLGSDAEVTAVGDHKQCIMGYAGALEGIFTLYASEFGAKTHQLLLNHRSSAPLQKVQSSIAKVLDTATPANFPLQVDVTGTDCRILEFGDDSSEAEYLAGIVDEWIRVSEIAPREICILSKVLPEKYAGPLKEALAQRGHSSRVETSLDPLDEPLGRLLLDCLKLGALGRAPESWINAREVLEGSVSDDEVASVPSERLARFIFRLKREMARTSPGQDSADALCQQVIGFFGRKNLNSRYPQYVQGNLFDMVLNGFVASFADVLPEASWLTALQEVEGSNSVRVMSTHKSKGLEFDAVVFVGLDNEAFFDLHEKFLEGTSVLFVGLSRARKHLVLSSSDSRSFWRKAAAHDQVSRFVESLQAAGVQVHDLRNSTMETADSPPGSHGWRRKPSCTEDGSR